MSRVRVYMACSFDGYVAGPEDDLSWLEAERPDAPPADPGALGFEAFIADVGALLMGRRTHDVVKGLGLWMYGERPVLVATRRPLEPAAPSVRPVEGSIEAMVEEARRAAAGGDVYVDGADLVRQALDAGLVDELTLTVVPVLLGGGVSLFGGLTRRQDLEITAHHRYAQGMVQLTARPRLRELS